MTGYILAHIDYKYTPHHHPECENKMKHSGSYFAQLISHESHPWSKGSVEEQFFYFLSGLYIWSPTIHQLLNFYKTAHTISIPTNGRPLYSYKYRVNIWVYFKPTPIHRNMSHNACLILLPMHRKALHIFQIN